MTHVSGVQSSTAITKDIFDNASYIGKVRVDGQLIEAKHPALIDEATWNRCLEVRRRNRRNTSKTWTRRSYPLTPVLRYALRKHNAR